MIIEITVKSTCPVLFSGILVLKIFCKLFVAEFVFSKILCFQHIPMNSFRQINLNYGNCSLRDIKYHWVNFWWKHIKKESYKGYLGNKKQKAMFLVVSNMCTLVLRGPFNCMPDWGFKLTCALKSWVLQKKFVHPGVFFCQGDTQFTFPFNQWHSKTFSVDFIHVKYCL